MDNNLVPYQPIISDIKNLITTGQNAPIMPLTVLWL